MKNGSSHVRDTTGIDLVEGDLRKREGCPVDPEERALLGVRRAEGERERQLDRVDRAVLQADVFRLGVELGMGLTLGGGRGTGIRQPA